MALLILSAFITDEKTAAFVLLLLATASLGAGFGLTVPALNTLAAALHPAGVDRAILALNALLGLGTVLAPLFVAPALRRPLRPPRLLVGDAGHLRGALGRPRRRERAASTPSRRAQSRRRTGCQRDPGPVLDLCGVRRALRHLRDGQRKLVAGGDDERVGRVHRGRVARLTAFWAMVTIGRVVFAAVQEWIPSRMTYRVLPFVLAGAFVVVALLPNDKPALGVLAFGLAGLGCSALLPLTISFGQGELKDFSARVAGGVIAFYQVGYGVAAFGVGPLLAGGVSLPQIYAAAAVIAAILGGWSFRVAGRQPNPTSLHPHLGHRG
jgi:MFS family permease